MPRRPTTSATRKTLIGVALALCAQSLPNAGGALLAQTEGEYLYRVTLLRAAPGHYREFVATVEALIEWTREAGDEAPFWVRHSQGDQWDFMLIFPMGDHGTYQAAARRERRRAVWGSDPGREVKERLAALTAYREEWFARSVGLDELARRFDGMGFFHIEMFAGLPGKRAELLEQRRMENRFYERLGRQRNLLFARDGGSNWDAMTIGFYESLQGFAAAGEGTTPEEENAAARAAGFDGVGDISPYLRSLLSYHHDTLAVSVR